MKMKSIWVGSFLAFIAGANATEGGAQRPIPASEVVREPASIVRTFPGKVRGSKRVDLGFNVSGQLVYLKAFEGATVKEGELLAKLDERDFKYALDAAKANFHQAEANYDRKQGLFDKKVISQAELDQAEAVFIAARSSFDRATKDFEDTSLLAPFNGIVSKRAIENHEQVVAKKTIISLRDVSRVEVVIPVPAALIAAADPDRIESIEVKFDADHNIWYEAEVAEYATEANPVTQTYDVVVSLHSPDDINTFSGMSAKVKVLTQNDALQQGMLVPFESVYRMSGDDFVWVIPHDGGHPSRQKVIVEGFYQSKIRVVEGLNEGEWVATAGVDFLTEDVNVRPGRSGKDGLNQ